MDSNTVRIGLATPYFPVSLRGAVGRARDFLHEAAEHSVDIVCFPECYFPGMRHVGFPVARESQKDQARALADLQESAAHAGVATIIPMEWRTDIGMQNLAFVIGANGELLGSQTKNQLPPEEEDHFVAGVTRTLFVVRGMRFGIAICHEGWRYGESVRWAARRGAHVVFHPAFVGAAGPSRPPATWGKSSAPIWERTMSVRAAENSIYFASVNYALPTQEAATSIIGPDGGCIAHAPYGEEHLLTCDLDLRKATGLFARRFQPQLY
jgi:predicted amidohydrolase